MSGILAKYNICITGVNSEEEDEAKKQIKILGALFSKDLTRDTTCLLVKEKVGSHKYREAVKRNYVVLNLQWLTDCFTSNSLQPHENYLVKPFTGLKLSFTGFGMDDRSRLLQLINEFGGESVSMTQSTSHLIAACTDSEKISAAREWNVKIVNQEWFEECIRRNCLVDEKDFEVPSAVTIDKVSTANETVKMESAIALKIVSHPEEAVTISVSDLPTLRNVRSRCFERETFFITGFPPEVRDYIIRLLIMGAGNRHQVLTEEVTKILLGPNTHISVRDSAHSHPCGAECVKLRWLLDTAGLGSQLATTPDNQHLPSSSGAETPTQTSSVTVNAMVDAHENEIMLEGSQHRVGSDDVANCAEFGIRISSLHKNAGENFSSKMNTSSHKSVAVSKIPSTSASSNTISTARRQTDTDDLLSLTLSIAPSSGSSRANSGMTFVRPTGRPSSREMRGAVSKRQRREREVTVAAPEAYEQWGGGEEESQRVGYDIN